MIAQFIPFVIRNFPAVLFLLAVIIALARRHGSAVDRLLGWILLLPIGFSGLWAGIYHVFFPSIAAAHIGWQVSPFQFEVGMADLAIGVTACIAFWQDLSFQTGIVSVAAIFLFGDAIGHVRQMVVAGNFAPGNAGVPFYMDVISPLTAIALVVVLASRARRARVTQ